MSDWPTSLPQDFLVDGFSEQAPNLSLRQPMEAGPPKIRRRFTAGVRPIQGRLILTTAQVATLDGFYLTDCAGGALSFTWAHPRTGSDVSFNFVEPPSYRPLGGGEWETSLILEIVP